MASLQDKHRKVRHWLDQMFEGETVPPYEVNETTITVLYDLACKNEVVDKDTRLLLEDLGQKADEYNAEGRRLTRTLRSVGLTPESLTKTGNTALGTLVSTAQTLELKNTSTTSYLLAMKDLSQAALDVEDSRREEQHLSKELLRKTTTAMAHLNAIQRDEETLDQREKMNGPDLEKKAQTAVFLQSKATEYRNSLRQLRGQLEDSGVDATLYHHKLVNQAEELDKKREKIAELRAQLDSYHSLPPDVSLARVKIEEAKRELARLEDEVNRKLEMMTL
ncbi:HAUS1 [Branchiostoma lanceolatum]|uniref:HAUS1 protein n=1 Tax=Branchiostoma lanceolatum TaxID=7740 RepID=A0A8J9ZEC0_BRALA|nr:HAUS1 [Branchiostoma lanceolatum]